MANQQWNEPKSSPSQSQDRSKSASPDRSGGMQDEQKRAAGSKQEDPRKSADRPRANQ